MRQTLLRATLASLALAACTPVASVNSPPLDASADAPLADLGAPGTDTPAPGDVPSAPDVPAVADDVPPALDGPMPADVPSAADVPVATDVLPQGDVPVTGIRIHAERFRAEYTRFTGAS